MICLMTRCCLSTDFFSSSFQSASHFWNVSSRRAETLSFSFTLISPDTCRRSEHTYLCAERMGRPSPGFRALPSSVHFACCFHIGLPQASVSWRLPLIAGRTAGLSCLPPSVLPACLVHPWLAVIPVPLTSLASVISRHI